MTKTALALKSSTGTPEARKDYMAYFSHIQDSLVVYTTAEKGRSTPKGKVVLKLQDLPMGFKLKPVHTVEELMELTE